MSPPRSATQRPPPLVRQLSLQQIPLPSPSTTPAAPASSGPAPARRGLLRRQRSAEDAERPITRLLHSALRVTASALGPGFLADASPPPPPPTPPPAKPNRLRPVRVAWAELRKATPEAAEAVAVVAQRVGLSKPNNNARPPTCLPALARANLDIFLAHSGLVQCITSTLTSDPPPAPPVVTETVRVPPAVIPATPSPREPCRPPLSPLPSRPVLPIASQQTNNTTRRVNFRNAALRVINRGLTDSSAPAELRPPPAAADTRAFRVLSAPAHRSAAPLCAPPRPLLRSLSRRGLVQNSSDGGERVVPEVIVPAERNIRSAPPRRRLKAASATRKKGGSRRGEESSGDDEIEEHSVPAYQPSRSCNSAGPTRGGRRGLRVGAEIVTMVSLVSPAASTDESDDERSPRPSTPSPIATVTSSPAVPKPHKEGDALHSMAALSSVIVCARKITKSVSFQTRGSVPELVRRASTQLALAVASTTSTSPQQQSAAVPSDSTHATSQAKQHDVADTEQPQREDPKVKKKLVRTKSALFKYNSLSRSTSEGKPSFPQLSVTTSATPLSPPADSGGGDDDETVTVAAAPEVSSGLVLPASAPPSATLATQEDLEDEEDETPRPRFETPKEKECWQLYRKMCEKGLTVSFDTVLRGMLTPTEYRLRRGALLSTC